MGKFITSVALGLLIYIMALLFTAWIAQITGWHEERALRFTLSIFIGMLIAALRTESLDA